MSTEESANAWKKHETKKPIADINTNPFERDRAQRAARNTAAAASAADIKKIKDDAQRHFNQTHQTTNTGALMDRTLADAKAAYDADRLTRRQAPAEVRGVTTMRALQACIEFWQRNADSAPNFFESEFNYTSLTNCFVTRVFGRHESPTPETVSESYFECLEGNYLELPRIVDANGATIRKRGTPQPIPPTLYPRFIWPQEEAAARDAELRRAVGIMLNRDPARKAEDAANRKTPLAEQQKQVRANYKPDAVPRDVIGSGAL